MLLKDLTPELKAHWLLHLNAADLDLPTLKTQIRTYVRSQVALPNLKHPAYVHDWLEIPEMRATIEGWN